MSSLLYVLLALVMLGVLITLHEFGHFIASRLTGIEVMEFAAGMGPLIARKKSKKGTWFSLRVIPIGGYCRYYDEADGKPSFAFEKTGLEARDCNGFRSADELPGGDADRGVLFERARSAGDRQ